MADFMRGGKVYQRRGGYPALDPMYGAVASGWGPTSNELIHQKYNNVVSQLYGKTKLGAGMGMMHQGMRGSAGFSVGVGGIARAGERNLLKKLGYTVGQGGGVSGGGGGRWGAFGSRGEKFMPPKALGTMGKMWKSLGRGGKAAVIIGGAAIATAGAGLLIAGAARRRRRKRVMRANPGFKRSGGMPVDGGIGASGDLTLALRGARH